MPSVVLVSGIATGSMYALLGLGLVLEFRYSKILNLAHGGQALLAAYLFDSMRSVAFYPALLVAVGAAALTGLVIEYFAVERLANTSSVVRTMVTLGALLLIYGLSQEIWSTNLVGLGKSLFSHGTVHIFGTAVAVDLVIMSVVTVLLTAGTAVFLRRSEFGVVMRAAGDRPLLAQTMGVNSVLFGRVIWCIGGATAGLAGVLLSPIVNLDFTAYAVLVIFAYSAVLVGRMESIPLTFAGGIAIGVLQGAMTFFVGYGTSAAVPFVVGLVALLIGAKSLEWAETREAF